jgi:hypothetical protein
MTRQRRLRNKSTLGYVAWQRRLRHKVCPQSSFTNVSRPRSSFSTSAIARPPFNVAAGIFRPAHGSVSPPNLDVMSQSVWIEGDRLLNNDGAHSPHVIKLGGGSSAAALILDIALDDFEGCAAGRDQAIRAGPEHGLPVKGAERLCKLATEDTRRRGFRGLFAYSS